MTGLERSLLSHVSVSTFKAHVVHHLAPIDLFLLVVTEDSQLEKNASWVERVRAAYHPLSLATLPDAPPVARCECRLKGAAI
jgi:hypothetical protein